MSSQRGESGNNNIWQSRLDFPDSTASSDRQSSPASEAQPTADCQPETPHWPAMKEDFFRQKQLGQRVTTAGTCMVRAFPVFCFLQDPQRE